MSDLRDLALATLAHRNMLEGFELLALHQPNGVVRRGGSVLVAATRSPIPIFNEVLAIEDEVDAESMARAVQAMRDIDAPWLAHFRSDVGDHDASVALELGLEEEKVFLPAMVLTDLPTRSNSGSVLEVVRNDDTPVAKSTSIRTGEVVGIYDVGTAETARRRGYGWAMTRAAIVAGANSGATVATLQSSEMAFPLYSGHGFETIFDYRCFREPEAQLEEA